MVSKQPYKAPRGSLDWYEEVEDRAQQKLWDEMRAEAARQAPLRHSNQPSRNNLRHAQHPGGAAVRSGRHDGNHRNAGLC